MREKLEEFFRKHYKEALFNVVREEKESLEIDFNILDKFDYELAEKLLEEPKEVLKESEEAIKAIDLPTEEEPKIKVRVKNIPESEKSRIRDLRSKHLGRLVKVEGTVRRGSDVKPELETVVYECPDCGEKIKIPQLKKRLKKPSQCTCGRKRGFKQVGRELNDARWLTLEDLFEEVSGEKPGEVNVYLKDDLTTPRMQKKTDPGARLQITGILRELPKRIGGKKTRQLEMFLEANHIVSKEVEFEELEVSEEDLKKIKELSSRDDIYQKLRNSLAPSMYGMDEIKETIVLQLFGGIPHELPDGTKIRGNIHVLLVGDPGVGKTAAMKLVTDLIPRGRYVSGKGITPAGLCVTGDSLLMKENGELVRIDKVVENEFEMNGKQKTRDGVYFSKNPSKLKIMSFDSEEMKTVPLEVEQYWKIKSPEKLVRIKTQLGKEIKTTPENPIPIFDAGEIKWIKAENLTGEEFLITPRNLNSFAHSSKKKEKIPINEFLDKTSKLQNPSKIVNNFADKIKENGGIREFCKRTGIGGDSLYYSWRKDERRGAPSLSDLEMISDCLNENLVAKLPEKMILSQQNGHEIALPKYLNKDLMYLLGLLAGDGDLSHSKWGGIGIRFNNSDKEMLSTFSRISQNFGVQAYLSKGGNRTPSLRFGSKIIGKIALQFGIPIGEKRNKLKLTEKITRLPDELVASYLKGLFDTDGYVNQRKDSSGSLSIELSSSSKEFIRQIQMLLLRFGIRSKLREREPTESVIRGKKVKSNEKFCLTITQKAMMEKFKEKIGFGNSEKKKDLDEVLNEITEYRTNVDLVPHVGKLIRKARRKLGISARELYGYKNYGYETGRMRPSRKKIKEIVNRLKEFGYEGILEKISNSDVFFEGIKEVEIIDSEDEWVYDLTVKGEHSFVTNGLVVHNTASVVRDEEFTGGWVLEAGALVLSSESILALDEFDKISPEDQSNLHEAMSTNTVSISKATIQATLPANTSIIGGANPKLSRFDPYRPINEQIDIPDTLLSRFDIRFALRDVPDKEADSELVDHVIKGRIEEEEIKPEIDPEFLKKYIAYARENSKPEMSKEAASVLKEFYVNLRNKYTEEEEAPTVPIGLRQYEALMRLSEASAKVKLKEMVEEEDARRAIKLMKYSLKQLGMDPETGRIDIDRAEGGMPSSKRSKFRIVMDVLDELEEELGENIPTEDVVAALEEEGMANADKVLREMKQKGMVFEPRPGYIQKI